MGTVLELLQEEGDGAGTTTAATAAAYFENAGCMASAMGLIRSVAAASSAASAASPDGGNLADTLLGQGARDVVFAAMSRHRFNDGLLALASAALSALESNLSAAVADGGDAGSAGEFARCLAAFEAGAAAVAGGAVDPDTLASIAAATQVVKRGKI